jgi:C1A family cysteine protease
MPKEGESIIGAHAVLVVGYDDAKRLLIVRNSWGDKWGRGGYFYMPYDYASNPNLVWDCWVMYKMEGV